MRIKEGQIFNLMDTNGRRNDVINALQGYLTILDDIQNEQKMNWASMPESLAQYEFYRQAMQQFQLSMSMSLVLPGTIFREKELIF